MSKVAINESTLTAIGDAIREKTGKTDLIAPGDMSQEIVNIPGESVPEEALTVTGNCQYRFSQNSLNNFIEYFNTRIKTNNIISVSYMFSNSTELEAIPFEIVFSNSYLSTMDYMFYNCNKLTQLPKISNCNPNSMSYMFSNCYSLREIPDEFVDGFRANTGSCTTFSYMLYNCYSLRRFPKELLIKGFYQNDWSSSSNTYTTHLCDGCHSIDELNNLPLPYTLAWYSNIFSGFANYCSRLMNLTFETNEDGSSKVMQMKSQSIYLNDVGYTINNDFKSRILNYNSGITAEKEVIDDATYQALKEDPDWFTADIAYSRYNHDSAVRTINSLPDTSAFLATAGGTNTIRFKGAAGSKTDGGAINTLTEAEIAVAAAKGWTVTLV